MELRTDTADWKSNPAPLDKGSFEYFAHCQKFVEDKYSTNLEHYRHILPETLTLDRFWIEFVWCCYVSGFSSKVIASIYDDLVLALGSWRTCHLDRWDNVSIVISHRKKFEACCNVSAMLRELPFEKFKLDFLSSTKSIRNLPMMGPITSFHLARNIGLDAVKPDLHLTRLSAHFGYLYPFDLCRDLADSSGERIGVVDYILFMGASTWSTYNIL